MPKQSKNDKAVMAFAFTSLFWVAVLGWATSYAPTKPEKEACYQAAAKSGRGTDECKTFWERTTSEPIALFTLVLAFSTVGLWVATIGLYSAGERQLAHLEDTAKRELRAYIGVEPRGVKRLMGQDILIGHYAICNVGGIPAKNISMFAVADYYLNGSQRTFRIGQVYETEIALPPRAEMVFGTATGVDIDSIEVDPSVVSGLAGFIFVYGKVAYTDEFGTDGWTEFCHRYPCEMMDGSERIRRKYARYHEMGGNRAN